MSAKKQNGGRHGARFRAGSGAITGCGFGAIRASGARGNPIRGRGTGCGITGCMTHAHSDVGGGEFRETPSSRMATGRGRTLKISLTGLCNCCCCSGCSARSVAHRDVGDGLCLRSTYTLTQAYGGCWKSTVRRSNSGHFRQDTHFLGGSRRDLRRNTAGERAFLRATELNTAAGNN